MTDHIPSRLRADHWYSSDEYRELGDRVRWPLLWENEQSSRERYWHMVLVTLAGAAPREPAQPIVDVPVQLALLGAA